MKLIDLFGFIEIFMTFILTLLVVPFSRTQANETNSIGITMINIPGGNFVMGSCPRIENKQYSIFNVALTNSTDPICLTGKPESNISDAETPQHRVKISAFQISKTEVTFGQFKKFIESRDSELAKDDDFINYNTAGDNAPIVYVSWNDAQAFINWLNEIDGGGYRLPSEAEWEYACHADGGDTYCGGDNIDDVAWYEKNSNELQSSVASKRANSFGLYDMSGNAWEWVQDCWHENYNGAPIDGSAWNSNCTGNWRGLRGGSWSNSAKNARTNFRNGFSPDYRYSNVGFRLARTR